MVGCATSESRHSAPSFGLAGPRCPFALLLHAVLQKLGLFLSPRARRPSLSLCKPRSIPFLLRGHWHLLRVQSGGVKSIFVSGFNALLIRDKHIRSRGVCPKSASTGTSPDCSRIFSVLTSLCTSYEESLLSKRCIHATDPPFEVKAMLWSWILFNPRRIPKQSSCAQDATTELRPAFRATRIQSSCP